MDKSILKELENQFDIIVDWRKRFAEELFADIKKDERLKELDWGIYQQELCFYSPSPKNDRKNIIIEINNFYVYLDTEDTTNILGIADDFFENEKDNYRVYFLIDFIRKYDYFLNKIKKDILKLIEKLNIEE